MENIQGKEVAITGASSGIGKAKAIELAKNGAKVALDARNAGKDCCTNQPLNIFEDK